MNDHSAGHAELPRSAYLDHTLRRAWNAAEHRHHRYVTLEHLLLALLDDPDATELLQAVDADIPIIQGSVATAINNNTSLVAPGGATPAFSYKFDNLFAGAFEHAVRAGRREIDGAFLLVAVAKHPDSDASAILAANGFHAQAAQRTLDALLGPSPQASATSQTPPPRPSRAKNGAKPKTESQQAQTPPRPAPDPKPAAAPQGGGTGTGDRFMEDMLASVRGILDSENRKDWALAPLLNPAATLPSLAPKRAQPRLEPQLRAEALNDGQRAPVPPPSQAHYQAQSPQQAQAPHQVQERALPALNPELPPRPSITSSALQPPVSSPPTGFAEPKAPAFDLELPAPPRAQEQPREKLQERPQEKAPGKKRKSPVPKPSRAQKDPPGALAQALETIPRTFRLARGQIVEIRLGKEQAGQLFARPAQRQQQGGEPVRAVSVRLSAPEGGFFIETMTPETQWLLNRPSTAGEEPFGSWSWAVVPNETGRQTLAVSVSVRDIDTNGVLTGSQVAGETIKIRVRANPGRFLGGLIRTLFLLSAGAGLAAGAWYVLNALGKLPH